MDTNIVLSSFTIPDLLHPIEEIINKAFEKKLREEFSEKLLSPADTCKLFQPAISKVTLAAWTKQGLLNDYRIGGRVYYRQGEVIEAAKTLKKFKRGKI